MSKLIGEKSIDGPKQLEEKGVIIGRKKKLPL
jgi:hypothetical protein